MTASVEELRALPWARLIAESKSSSCDHVHSTLMKWIREVALPADEAGRWHQVEPVLGLFIDIDPDAERAYSPAALLDSIPKELLRNLAAIADEFPSDDVRARILDLAWMVKSCDHTRVAAAVAAFIRSAEERMDPTDWLHAYTRLKRALELGASIGRTQAFQDALAAVEKVLDRLGAADPLWLSHRLMLMLLRLDAGDPARYAALAHAIAVAARAKYEANGIGNGLECEREQGYLDLEIKWRQRLQDDESVRRLHIEVADALVRKADGVLAVPWPNPKLVAAHFIEAAIERLRQVGGETAKVDALRLRLQTLQREAVAEMKAFKFSGVDVTDAVKEAKRLVSGKDAFQALCALAFGYCPPTLSDLHDEVRLSVKDTPFKALIPQSYLGPRGTVLAEHAGIANQTDSTGFELETMRMAHGRQSWVAIVYFHAAAEHIRYEHGLDTPYFAQLANASAFVPRGRVKSWARGLAAGLRGDYELVPPILIPQFEHAVRELFVGRGIVTATLPSTGAQNEFNLNQLLVHPRAAEVFGDELLFDQRVLLTEKAGANLRNDVAHGLLADGDNIGAKIYFWWICLHLVLVPLLPRQSDPARGGAMQPDQAKDTVVEPGSGGSGASGS